MSLRCYPLLLALLAFLLPHLGWAQVTAPTKGGEVSLIRVTTTTMELSFGMTGTGQGRVVMMAAVVGGNSVPLAAADGIFYAADATYGKGAAIGSGYVVYCGTGHSATVTGLVPSTYYYITSAEYNRDSTHVAYNTRSSSVATRTRAGAAALATQSGSGRTLDVYPNPSAGQAVQLALHGYEGATCLLSLTDALGRQVASQHLTPTEASQLTPLELPQNLASGAYLLTVAVGSDAPLHKQLIITN